MQRFSDIIDLLTAFQMSYIYHPVAILAYKISFKSILLSIHHTEIKQLKYRD